MLRPVNGTRLVLLNNVAAVVWELWAAGLETTVIAERLARHFRQSRIRILDEIDALIAQWSTQGLLAPAGPDHPRRRAALPPPPTAPLFEVVLRLARSTVRVRSHVPRLGRLIAGRLWHHRVATTTPDVTVDVHGDGETCVAWCDGQQVLYEEDPSRVASRLYCLLVRLDNPGEAFLAFPHAAALVTGGTSVLLCGGSGRGKTTLAAGLLSEGFTYLGDEILGIVASDFTIRSLPTALSIKVGGMGVIRGLFGAVPRGWPSPDDVTVEGFVDPRPLGPTATEGPRPSAIIFPRFSADATPASIQLTPLEAFAELIDAGISLDEGLFGRGSPGRLIEFVETTPCHRLRYGTFEDAYRGVRALLGQ